jgi:hypothetical protein
MRWRRSGTHPRHRRDPPPLRSGARPSSPVPALTADLLHRRSQSRNTTSCRTQLSGPLLRFHPLWTSIQSPRPPVADPCAILGSNLVMMVPPEHAQLLRLPVLQRVEFRRFSLYSNRLTQEVPVRPGVFCVAGGNGLGKSTFLNAMATGLTRLVPNPRDRFDSGVVAPNWQTIRWGMVWRSAAIGADKDQPPRQAFPVRPFSERTAHGTSRASG